MNKVIIDTARTEQGYSAACSLLPGWVVAYSGDFEGFRQYVQESIDFEIEGYKKGARLILMSLMVNTSFTSSSMSAHSWTTTVASSPLPRSSSSRASTKSSWLTMPLASPSRAQRKPRKLPTACTD